MDRTLADWLNRPLAIGRRQVSPRLVLAPMTGLGHVAFREMLADFGGYGLLWSEMCSARRLPAENPRRSACFRWNEAERSHLVCQIVGREPVPVVAAARRIEAEGFFGVDLNFGCSVGTVCRHHGAAALLREPERAADLVAAVRQAVACPVTVKFRTGWQDAPEPAVAMARRFEAAGADALTFHPRVAPDRRTRPPRWEYIRRVKEAVGIPVFGNGNVFSAADCRRMIDTTGCDGVAVGRMAIARPWLFAEWTRGFVPDAAIHRRTVLRLIERLAVHFEPAQALRRFRRFADYFAANFKFGHTLRRRLAVVGDLAAAGEAVVEFLAVASEPTAGPNLNFFH